MEVGGGVENGGGRWAVDTLGERNQQAPVTDRVPDMRKSWASAGKVPSLGGGLFTKTGLQGYQLHVISLSSIHGQWGLTSTTTLRVLLSRPPVTANTTARQQARVLISLLGGTDFYWPP